MDEPNQSVQPPDEPNQSVQPAPEPNQSVQPPAPAAPPPPPPPPPPPTPAPAFQNAGDLYQKGYKTGQTGGMPMCPANTDAQGEAAYDQGYADGKRDAAKAEQDKMPSVRQSTPDEYLETRMITMLSDDGVGTVQKSVTGTKKELDDLQARAYDQINSTVLNNLASGLAGVGTGRAANQGIGIDSAQQQRFDGKSNASQNQR